jgi:2-methylcitrate dehydratase PrpD
MSALLAREGMTGPAEVFEGRFGLFASHLQDPETPREFARIAGRLGEHWDSRNASLKPFPAAHVLHPYISALLRLQRREGFSAIDVDEIDCPVAAFIVPIVCEPTEEKWSPASDSHGRVSLQYTLAEALFTGRLGRDAYRPETLRDPGILALARRVRYHVDSQFPGPGRFKGAVHVALKDGRSLVEVEEYNRGSAENPMTYEEIRAKFDENARGFLSQSRRDALADHVGRLDRLADASVIVDLATQA